MVWAIMINDPFDNKNIIGYSGNIDPITMMAKSEKNVIKKLITL